MARRSRRRSTRWTRRCRSSRATPRAARRTSRCWKKGELDIGLVQGEAVHEAFAGIGRPPANLLIIAAMYSSPGMFVVRADSPYKTIADLKGKPVAMGAQGFGPGDPRPLRHRRHRPRRRARLPADLSRSRRRRPGDGARRPRRGAVGRRHRLAGLRRRWRKRPAARASSRPTPTRSTASSPSTRFLRRITVPANTLRRARPRRSLRSARGVSCSRGRRCPTTSPTASPRRCIAARR